MCIGHAPLAHRGLTAPWAQMLGGSILPCGRHATEIENRRPNTARIRAVSWYNLNGSKLPMSYAQGARIGLGLAAATSRVNSCVAVGAALRPSVAALWPLALRGDAPCPWEAGALRAPALETRNDDERTLRARIREAYARREGPGARPRVAKRPHRLPARTRAHPAAGRLHD